MHTNCKIREIPPAEWPAFADQFSRLHKGQRATVETFDPDLGTQANAQALPLMGLAAECSPDGGTEIEILLGDSGTPHSAYSMGRPSHVYVTEWNDAVSSALQIELEDGRVTVVRVGPAEQTLPPGFITDGTVWTPPAHPGRRAG